ncbi:MAG TPA: hypothetical protein VIJ15_04405 [Dermatophilaceae bacterium]
MADNTDALQRTAEDHRASLRPGPTAEATGKAAEPAARRHTPPVKDAEPAKG